MSIFGGPCLTPLESGPRILEWARAAGHPDDVTGFLLEAYGNTPEVGRTVVDPVEKLTGRPARTFTRWAAEHADAFTATAAAVGTARPAQG